MDRFEKVIKEAADDLKKRETYNKNDIDNFFTSFYNLSYEARANINVEQRINHLKEVEKNGINKIERNKIAKSIDSDVDDWFVMINNDFKNDKNKTINEIERFFKEIDKFIEIEEFIISLYIEDMQQIYQENVNSYRKRILVLLSEKSKSYKTIYGKFYINDEEKRAHWEKFNNNLEKICDVEKTYVPPMFDKKMYGISQKRKHIAKRMILGIILCIAIILTIFIYIYDKYIFKSFIVVIFLSVAILEMNRFKRKRNREFRDKRTANLIINQIEDKFENNNKEHYEYKLKLIK